MDWIRRNWPDLLIGVALLAVIAGIIATLLNGGSFLPFANPSASPSVSSPAPNFQTTPQTNSQTTPEATQPQTSEPVTPGSSEGAEQTEQNGVTAVPPGQSVEEDSPEETAAEGAEVTPVAPGASQDESDPVEPEVQAAPAAQSAASEAAGLPSEPFRIGVGSFSQAENAERHAEAFREEGYPVFVAQQGAFAVVLVGPYDSRSEAEAVLSEIRSSGLEANPILYELEGGAAEDEDAAAAGEGEASAEAASSAEGVPAAATSASGGTYIQVGAYNSEELATPQRERLEQLGYSTRLQRGDGSDLIRLWVGPFDSDSVAEVRTQLSDLGIDNFVPSQ